MLLGSISEPPWSLSLLLGLPGVRCYLTVLSYLHSLTLRGPLSGRVTARAAKPAAVGLISRRPGQGSSASRSSRQRRALEQAAGIGRALGEVLSGSISEPPWNLSLLLGLLGAAVILRS